MAATLPTHFKEGFDIDDEIDDRVTFHEDTDTQKKCLPGPEARFGPTELKYVSYAANMGRPNVFGCGPDKFAKYTSGKYCCTDTPPTLQERFDYVNDLIDNFMQNVEPTQFGKNNVLGGIDYIIKSVRPFIIQQAKKNGVVLQDDFENFQEVLDWYNDMVAQYNKLKKPFTIPDPAERQQTLRDNAEAETLAYNSKRTANQTFDPHGSYDKSMFVTARRNSGGKSKRSKLFKPKKGTQVKKSHEKNKTRRHKK